jgi:ketosteroid isomerase-like protein
MTPSGAAQIVQSLYEDFARGDMPAVMGRLAEDISWRIPGDHLVSGNFSGHDEIVAFFQQINELSGGTFRVDVHEILEGASGTVVALMTISAERDGRRGSFETVHVWRIEDARATSFREYHDRQAAINAFWS